MNGLFFEYMNERDCKRHNIPITRETTRDFTKDLEEFAELLSKLSKTQKASVVMCMEHLQPGSFTEENDLEIKINRRKITLNQYIEKHFPDADAAEAKKLYKELKMGRGCFYV